MTPNAIVTFASGIEFKEQFGVSATSDNYRNCAVSTASPAIVALATR